MLRLRTARRWTLWLLALLLLLAGCEYDKDEDANRQAPGFPTSAPDEPFWQASRVEHLRADIEGYLSESPQPPKPIHAVRQFAGAVFVGTDDGLFEFDGESWTPRTAERPILRLLAADDRLYAGADGAVLVYDGAAIDEWPLPQNVRATALAAADGRLYVGTEAGLYARSGDGFQALPEMDGVFVFDLLPDPDGSLWAATADGVALLQDDAIVRRWTQQDYLLSDTVRALALDDNGRLWIGTALGLNVLDRRGRLNAYTGGQGLPYPEITRLLWVGDGAAAGLWIGTLRGAIHYVGGEWRYYAGRRWLPDDSVADLATGDENQIWLATGNGAARLAFQETDLAAKADAYLDLTEARHERYGLVAPCDLELPGDLSTVRLRDSNNDGMFTGLFLAAASFAYAATGDPAFQTLADRHFAALALLEQATGIPGLPARSIAPLYTYSADPQCAPFCQWQANEELGWDWKSDEGSEELTGQFFGLAAYYDLAADEAHRSAVAQLAGRIVDYLIDHDYYLIDWDGQPTTTGVFNPAALWQWLKQPTLDQKMMCLAQLGPNGAAILAMLRTAQHMTGERRYADAYESLLREHAMAEFLVAAAKRLPIFSSHTTYQLFFLNFHPLLSYETDEQRRRVYLAALERLFGFVSLERNSLFNFIYGALTAGERDFALNDALSSLRRMPLDLVDWRMENSQRADVTLDPFPNRFGEALSSTDLPPLPPDERAIMDWGGDPFVLDAGGYGSSEETGVFWLLPYWMARRYGFIEP